MNATRKNTSKIAGQDTRDLIDSDTNESIGLATVEQIAASDGAGDTGHITIDRETGAVIAEDRVSDYDSADIRRVYVASE